MRAPGSRPTTTPVTNSLAPTTRPSRGARAEPVGAATGTWGLWQSLGHCSPCGGFPLVALMPQWRQDDPNNRPPTRATAISEMGQDLPPALQKRSGDSCSEARQKWWRRGNPKFQARVSRPFPSDPGRDSLCAAAEAEKRALMKRFTETSGSLRRGKYRWRLRCCYPAGSAAERPAGGRFFRHMIVMVRAVRRALNKSAQ
jgi:hypothetical protein